FRLQQVSGCELHQRTSLQSVVPVAADFNNRPVFSGLQNLPHTSGVMVIIDANPGNQAPWETLMEKELRLFAGAYHGVPEIARLDGSPGKRSNGSAICMEPGDVRGCIPVGQRVPLA